MSAAPASERPSPGRVWWLATRPKTLTASAAPVLVGSALAAQSGAHRWSVTFVCLATAMLLQVSANLANDWLDFARGIDHAQRVGPTRVTQAGWLSPRAVAAATGVALALALVGGVWLVARGGAPILTIGVVSMLAALAYSGGPYPLSTHGLGEVAAFAFFGPVAVAGTAYVHRGAFAADAWVASVPVGALVAAIMLVNNLRDIPSDAAVGKRTLAVRIGPDRTRALFGGLIALAFGWVLGMAVLGQLGALLALGSLPLAYPLWERVRQARSGDEFNVALAHTARLQGAHGALLALGLAL